MSFYSIESNPLVRSRYLEINGRIDRNTDTANIIQDAIDLNILGWAPTGTNNENIYNQNVGNVGIGTLTPSYKLDVQGSAHISSTIEFDGDVNVNFGNLNIDSGNLNMVLGKINLSTVGGGQSAGVATLVGGSVTVNTTKASSINSYAYVTYKTHSNPGFLRVTINNGSIVISSSNGADASQVYWVLFN